MEQVCNTSTPQSVSSPVQPVMGSPAGAFPSVSSHGPFTLAASSTGAAYQQSVQSDPQAMGGGTAMGRVSGDPLCLACAISIKCTRVACTTAWVISLGHATTHQHNLPYQLSCVPFAHLHGSCFVTMSVGCFAIPPRPPGQLDRQIDRLADRQLYRQSGRQAALQTDWQTGSFADRQTDGQVDNRQVDRPAGRQTKTQTDRQTDGQTDRQT